MPGLFDRVRGRRQAETEANADAPTEQHAQPPAASDGAEQPPPLPAVVPEQPTQEQALAVVEPEVAPADPTEESWRKRSRLRRRARYLRRARELALRDLGGLVFDLDRFGRDRPDLVRAKLDSLGAIDRERRTIEAALGEQHELDILREPGVASCPRCGALHGSDARFCSSCGLPVGPGAPLPPGPAPTTGDEPQPSPPAASEPVPGAAAAISDTSAT